jgi:DNA repair exonuclease SbcCD ATPase subunit
VRNKVNNVGSDEILNKVGIEKPQEIIVHVDSPSRWPGKEIKMEVNDVAVVEKRVTVNELDVKIKKLLREVRVIRKEKKTLLKSCGVSEKQIAVEIAVVRKEKNEVRERIKKLLREVRVIRKEKNEVRERIKKLLREVRVIRKEKKTLQIGSNITTGSVIRRPEADLNERKKIINKIWGLSNDIKLRLWDVRELRERKSGLSNDIKLRLWDVRELRERKSALARIL